MDDRRTDISSALPGTCDWVLDSEQFRKWHNREDVSSHNGVLWVQGKPGTGKSTLMKHILEKCETKFSEKHLIAAHFFNARGDRFEQTPLGMLRSILYQLVDKEPSIYEQFIPLFREKWQKHREWEWREEELKQFLLSETQRYSKPMLLLIDALDECSESYVREVVHFLEDLSINAEAHLILCLSSRHYPNITMQKRLQLVVERTLQHDHDIKVYVGKRLTNPDENIKRELLKNASGVFLWVVLVVEMLNKAHDEGKLEAMRKRLNDIPRNLDEVFQDLLTKDNEEKQETVFMLDFVLFARRLLRAEELYFATMTHIHAQDTGPWDSEKLTQDVIRRRIIQSSRGLIEVRQGGTSTVQFIHKSVNDFLLRNKRLQLLDPSLSPNIIGTSHERLESTCMAYLMMESLASAKSRDEVKELKPEYPFLEYASVYMFDHAEEAESSGARQAGFLQKLSEDHATYERVRLLHNALEESPGSGCTKRASLLYMLAFHGYSGLTKSLLEMRTDPNAGGGLFGTALQAAAAKGNKQVVAVLLEGGADVNAQGGYYNTALQAAVVRGDTTMMRMLLKAGGDVNAQGGRYHTALQAAVEMASDDMTEIVALLLREGANINTQGGMLGTALQAAATRGDETMVAWLLREGANVNARGGHHGTALQAAAAHDSETIVAMLLAEGANVNARGGFWGTALQAAAGQGHEAVVELLLRNGADVNLHGGALGTALQAATFRGHKSIEELLLHAGADRRSPSAVTIALLQEARDAGDVEEVLEILRRERRDGNNRDIHRFALRDSIRNDWPGVMEVLVQKEVNAETQWMFDSALVYIIQQDTEESVKILLEKGANPNVDGDSFPGALEMAVASEEEEMMALLIENGANVNIGSCSANNEAGAQDIQIPVAIYICLATLMMGLLLMDLKNLVL